MSNSVNSNSTNEEISIKEEVFDWLDTSVKTMVVALLVFTFVFSLSSVRQESMVPTLLDGERVIVYSLFYKPKFRDVVVVTKPNYLNHNLVKRVIATGGQTVNIDPVAKKVFVDGKELDEHEYINELTERVSDVQYPVTVPDNMIFVMGDNRNVSLDSRDSSIGMIDNRYVRGRVVFRVWPLNRIGVIK